MLVRETLRARWLSTLLWAVGGGLFHLVIGAAWVSQVSRSPSAATELARQLEVSVSSMRLLRWPADRLDTLGGYLSYHNVTLLTLFLALWAAVQGARLTRGGSVQALELVLSTGAPRAVVLRDRLLGFLLQLALISVGMGGGLFLASVVAGAADLGGAALTTLATAGVVLAGYGLGLLCAQLVASASAASGLACCVLVAAYLFANAWALTGAWGVARYLSPFFFHAQSRAFVPGEQFSGWAFAATLAQGAAAWLLGLALFTRRELGGAWLRARAPRRASVKGARVRMRGYAREELGRTRWRLAAWAVSTAGFGALMAWLAPTVEEALSALESMRVMLAQLGPASAAEQYLAFCADFFAPILAAFAIAVVGDWGREARDGRLELLRAQPLSWSRLVLGRLTTLACGAALVAGVGTLGLGLGALAVGTEVSAVGALRAAAGAWSAAMAVGGVGALLVSFTRGSVTVPLLAGWLGVSALLLFAAPLFAWPAWVVRLSVFGALGHLYFDAPALGGVALMAGLALGGASSAVLLSRRLPLVR